MAKLKFKDIKKIGEHERKEKMQELKLTLLQSNLANKKINISRKEIKRSIARLLTFRTSVGKTKPLKRADEEVLKKK